MNSQYHEDYMRFRRFVYVHQVGMWLCRRCRSYVADPDKHSC